MKIEKIIKTFAIAAVMTGSVFTFSQTTKAATISIEKAAQKIYKAETKAYNTKKDVSVTVKVAAPSKTKKAIKKVTGEIEDALIKEELGDVDLTRVVRNTYVRPSIGELFMGYGSAYKLSHDFYRFYYPQSQGADQYVSYKNGVLTIKLDIKGSKKWYRDQYKENTYLAKCVADLREQTDGLSEKDKAWTVAEWVEARVGNDQGKPGGNRTTYSLIWEENAVGTCEQQAMANQLFGCLMGLNTGFVVNDEHAWNCVKIDGEIYYYDGTDAETREWKAFVKGQANAAKISRIIEVKEWVDGTTVGEWCLLKQDEFAETSNMDGIPSEWKIYWKLGNRFENTNGSVDLK